jgi:uncharacterized Tic20 family protein
MTIGASVFLVAIGAVLRYAVTIESEAINIDVVGAILMIAGAVGLVLSLFFYITAQQKNNSNSPANRPPEDGYLR